MREITSNAEITKTIYGLCFLVVWGGILYLSEEILIVAIYKLFGLQFTRGDVSLVFIIGLAIGCKYIFKYVDKKQK